MAVRRAEPFREPTPPVADILRAWIIRSVGEPQGYVAAAQTRGDPDAIDNVIQGGPPDFRVGVAKRAVLVNLILERIGIDRAGAQPMFRCQHLNFSRVADSARKIPEDVQCQRRTRAGPTVDLPGVSEFFLN